MEAVNLFLDCAQALGRLRLSLGLASEASGRDYS